MLDRDKFIFSLSLNAQIVIFYCHVMVKLHPQIDVHWYLVNLPPCSTNNEKNCIYL